MLVEVGCRYVLVGHSERRREIGETDEQINRKVQAALVHGVTPILCVGETADERRQGLTFTTIEGQLRAACQPRVRRDRSGRPRLRAGVGDRTGIQRHPRQAAEVHGYLRGLLSELSSKDVAGAIRSLRRSV